MSPQHGIFIINIVIYIICTIPFATTNHIHHSSYPLPFASISGENDIPQKSIRSYSTNNGEWRRNYRIVDIIENVNMTRTWRKGRKTSDRNVFQYIFSRFHATLTTRFSSIYRVCMWRRRKEKNLENISHMCCDSVVARFSSIFLFLTFCHSCSFIWQ